MSNRTQFPIRFRKARSDSEVGSMARWIETSLGLPAGSVSFRKPDGSTIRRNAKVKKLRQVWE
jgi:hypothetical protein